MLEPDWVPKVLEQRGREALRQHYGVGGRARRRMPLLDRIVRHQRAPE
jgi:hypothetical protein